jgi:hypothetical protein
VSTPETAASMPRCPSSTHFDRRLAARGRRHVRALTARGRCLWGVLTLLGLVSQAAAEASWTSLDGRWIGPGLELMVDSTRAQARIDPALPFAWKAFAIKNITDDMIVFTIGPYQFVGLLEGDQLTVTSPSLQGSRALRRAPPPSAAPALPGVP